MSVSLFCLTYFCCLSLSLAVCAARSVSLFFFCSFLNLWVLHASPVLLPPPFSLSLSLSQCLWRGLRPAVVYSVVQSGCVTALCARCMHVCLLARLVCADGKEAANVSLGGDAVSCSSPVRRFCPATALLGHFLCGPPSASATLNKWVCFQDVNMQPLSALCRCGSS